ncbi:hypothetical protein L596_028147 [Steinernema carpocapsae]|uniref:Tyrosine-protein phosphatase domain-containing protein n=1 Tax=Steinernema carpocapsae TaxID=34508 RepID=A0A4U5LXK5_STECR|nr:hypothetical protein L596_028147 [Steinernema carpocapsae]
MGNKPNKAQKTPSRVGKQPRMAKSEMLLTPELPEADLETRRRTRTHMGSAGNSEDAPQSPQVVREKPKAPPKVGSAEKMTPRPRKTASVNEKHRPKPIAAAEAPRSPDGATNRPRAANSARKPKKREPLQEPPESSILTAQSHREKDSARGHKHHAEAKPAPQPDVTKPLIHAFCEATLNKGIAGLRQDYARVKGETIPTADKVTAFIEHQQYGRNRYRDVPCLDESRVKLRNHPAGHDYIHANYVTTPFSARRFICCQAPLPATCYDFWLLILQEEAEFVLMLCNFVEADKPKCAEYVPMDVYATLNFNDISICVLSVDIMKCEKPNLELTEKIIERQLKIKKGDVERYITHYVWESWPDHGVPSTDLSPLVLLQRVRTTTQPIVVHCSAGIGRTGSIVAIEYVLERIIFHQRCDDTADVLKSLRNQRALSIQTEMQYLYVHRILLRYYTELRYIDQTNPGLMKFLADYDHAVATDPKGKPSPVQPQEAPPQPQPQTAQQPLQSAPQTAVQQPQTQAPPPQEHVEQQPIQQEYKEKEQPPHKELEELDAINPPRW